MRMMRRWSRNRCVRTTRTIPRSIWKSALLKTGNGEYRWYRARASADRNMEGRAMRLSGSLQDVTEARIAREELVQATEAAQAASRAKSHFFGERESRNSHADETGSSA